MITALIEFVEYLSYMALIYAILSFAYWLPMGVKFVVCGGLPNESWDDYCHRKRWEKSVRRMRKES